MHFRQKTQQQKNLEYDHNKELIKQRALSKTDIYIPDDIFDMVYDVAWHHGCRLGYEEIERNVSELMLIVIACREGSG